MKDTETSDLTIDWFVKRMVAGGGLAFAGFPAVALVVAGAIEVFKVMLSQHIWTYFLTQCLTPSVEERKSLGYGKSTGPFTSS